MGVHVCTECGRGFSRYSNMLRHKEALHAQEENTEDEVETSEDEETKDENTEREDDETDTAKEEDDQNEEEGDENEENEHANEEEQEEEENNDADDDTDDDDDDDNDDDDDEAEMYDLWTYLKDTANKDPELQTQYEEVRERLADGNLDDEEVRKQALRVIRPDTLKLIYDIYINFLNMWHFAKEDKYHIEIMKTKRKLMDEDDFEPVEAIHHAVKKRKYLIQKATGMQDDDPLDEKLPPPTVEEDESESEKTPQ